MATNEIEKEKIAIIQTKGKQYNVSVGEIVSIERIGGELKEGDTVVFDEVLLLDDNGNVEVGTPLLSGKKVEAEFLGDIREKKISVIRFRPKSRYSKKTGYRHTNSKVKITKIA
ncbi:MAG: large subunit ribosomal protein L21 [Flavobacteriaceae bacterium]|jgi:large subunit ribosomal protein L21